jgi:predicted Zn finger-like uncharacterized protein
MSQPSGRSREPEDKRADLAWSALFLVASVLGGLAAAKLTGESGPFAVALSLLVAAAMMVALYLGLLDQTDEPSAGVRRGAAHASGHVADSGRQLSTENPGPAFPGAADPPVQPGVVQLVQQPSDGQAWWAGQAADQAGQRLASAARPGTMANSGTADLSQFLSQALIAQCPNCGAFRIDVNSHRPTEWAFRCQECHRQWTWRPGHPWPPVQVRPNARG